MEQTLKIVVVGDCGAGKTTLCKHFVSECYWNEQEPTIGVDFVRKEVQHASYGRVVFNLWDTAGAEKFNSISMTQTYYRHADGVIYMFDLTNRASFDAVRDVWVKRIRSATTIYAHCRAVLVGNKSDLIVQRRVSVNDALRLAGELGCNYVELSSVRSTYEEIRQPFLMLATELLDTPGENEMCSVYSAHAVNDAAIRLDQSTYACLTQGPHIPAEEGCCT